jgi:hypothetical protein
VKDALVETLANASSLDDIWVALVDSISNLNPHAIIFVSMKELDGKSMRIVRTHGVEAIDGAVDTIIENGFIGFEFPPVGTNDAMLDESTSWYNKVGAQSMLKYRVWEEVYYATG